MPIAPRNMVAGNIRLMFHAFVLRTSIVVELLEHLGDDLTGVLHGLEIVLGLVEILRQLLQIGAH